MFSDNFDVMMLKIIFKNKKSIIETRITTAKTLLNTPLNTPLSFKA